jgi:protease-4
MAKKQEMNIGTKIIIAAAVLIGLSLVGSILAGFILLFSGVDTTITGGNTAVITVEGILVASTKGSWDGTVTSDDVIDFIELAEEDKDIEAVMFVINSPGGTAVASDEIGRAVKSMEKPAVAVIREVGASGAYWLASSTDHVIANRMSITGSIGVIGSYLSFGKFLEHWNVTYNQMTAGQLKDTGTPYRELSQRERAFLQEKLDTIHEIFIETMATNRNMSYDEMKPLADGRYYLGQEAYDVGLIDELGGEQEALAWIETQIGKEAVPVHYEKEVSFIDVLTHIETPSPLPGLDADARVPMAR